MAPTATQRLHESRVIPDVLPAIDEGGGITLHQTFKGSKEASSGEDLTPAEASAAPSLSFHGTDPGSFYTVILSDPDAPSPAAPSMREWLHWLVIDCRGGDVPSGRVLVPYQGPAPPRGRHRYVTSIFEQPGEGAAGLPSSDSDSRAQALAGSRGKFSTAGFAAQHQLGTAKAAAFFYSSTQE